MSGVSARRLKKLEDALIPPHPPVNILLVAEDDPDAERLIADHRRDLIEKHGTADFSFPTMIVLVPGRREEHQ